MKGCLTALGLFVLALIVASFFMPATMNLEVNKKLEASPEQVFAQVNNLKNWEQWSAWNEMDPEMTTTYGDNYVGKGGSYSWDGKKAGKGSLTIVESDPNEGIKTELIFKPSEDVHTSNFMISPAEGGGTDVKWNFISGEQPNRIMFWKSYMNAIFTPMVKKSYNKGLDNLDAYIKEHPDAHLTESMVQNELKIEEVNQDPFNGITVSKSGRLSEFGAKVYEEGFGSAMAAVEKAKAQVTGYPFAQWTEWDTIGDKYSLNIGLTVAEKGKSFGGTKALKASYYGPYEGMDLAYMALEAYGNDKGYTMGMPIEVYVTDPALEPDTSKWLTEIYFPIEE